MTDDLSEEAELLEIYFEESRELLEGVETDLLSIEASPQAVDPDLINRVFRAIHSVKGGAGFFSLDQVKALAHAMENVLGTIREGKLEPTSKVVEPLLNGADALSRRFNQPPSEAGPDFADLVDAVERGASSEPAPQHTAPTGVQPAETFEPLLEFETTTLRAELGPQYKLYVWSVPAERARSGALDQIVEVAAAIAQVVRVQMVGGAAFDLTVPETWASTSLQLLIASADPIDELIGALEAQPVEIVLFGEPEPPTIAPKPEAKAPTKPAAEPTPGPVNKPPSESSSIRVRLPLLDRLMTLAGELVLARNQLVQTVGSETDQALEASQRIDHITTELQDAIMSTRMQSVGTVFNKFRRIVRDLAKQLGKQVELTIEGEDVELDRTVIESISDPLTHLVRNALDHGLETPSERVAAGKSPVGNLRLRAAHKAGNVLIDISEDGRGIDSQRVRQLALERGLYSAEELAGMSLQGLNRIVMQPGFSTAPSVTDLSGRGVGMDVVGSNIKRLGGSVDLNSTQGKGTSVRVKLPLTLAIIPALLVTEEGRRFAIPQASLLELHRIPAARVTERILSLGTAEVLTLRGSLLPIVRLRSVLNMPDRSFVNDGGLRQRDMRGTIGDHRTLDDNSNEQRRSSVSSAVHVAVVASGELSYGLVLESWQETSEIVVKPLGRHLRQCSAYAGATILGDGDSALILDVSGIGSKLSSELAASQQDTHRHHPAQRSNAHRALPTLLLRGITGQLSAIPLELVTRVERTTSERIQTVMGTSSLRYHGGSLPLLPADIEGCGEPIIPQSGYVVVFHHGGAEAGVFAADLLDITETTHRIDTITMRRPGCLGSFHLGDELVLVLDLQTLANKHFAQVQGTHGAPPRGHGRVLVIEPADFFRTSLARALSNLGYEVVQTRGEEEAMAHIGKDSGPFIAAIVDVDSAPQPFLRTLARAEERFGSTVIGTTMTPPASAALVEDGRAAGVLNFFGKMNLDQIAKKIAESVPQGHDDIRVAG